MLACQDVVAGHIETVQPLACMVLSVVVRPGVDTTRPQVAIRRETCRVIGVRALLATG